MIHFDELTKYLYQEVFGTELLAIAQTKDERANGVQIRGSQEIKKVALGVSCNEAFLHEAVAWGANYCIFHHGLDTNVYKSRYPQASQKRLRLVFNHNLTIVGFHYALDAHTEIGNNAVILQKLGAKRAVAFFDEWGWVGTFEKPRSLDELRQQCESLFGGEIITFESGEQNVSKIGVVSGEAKPTARHIAEMEAKGVQLFVSGETSEWAPHTMMESEINYFVCGHYATEVFGIKALGEKLHEKYSNQIDIKFFDIPNPI
jgi:dinuclear metal center YbgI/SA1388 family protein